MFEPDGNSGSAAGSGMPPNAQAPTAADTAAQLSSSPVVTSPAPPVSNDGAGVYPTPSTDTAPNPAANPYGTSGSSSPYTDYSATASMNQPTTPPSASDAPTPDPGISSTPDLSTPSSPSDGPSSSSPPANGNLIDLKQDALKNLAPLVNHLDQTPEEKFRTTMMMIQASDNQDLVKDAYEAAKSITDEKARAQALLDVVNEINYFTQQHKAD